MKKNSILLILLIGILIIKSDQVLAMNQRISPTACYMYYNSGTTNRSGTVYNAITAGNLATYYCQVNAATNYASTRYDFLSDNIGTGTGSMIFFVADTTQINSVLVTTTNREYSCEVSHSFDLTDQSNVSIHMYNVNCSNIPINSSTTYSIKIMRFNWPSTQTGTWLSRDINFTLNDSSTISQTIDNQTNNIINSDTASADSKTNVDDSNYQAAHNKESQLLSDYQYNSNTINMTYDRNAAIWIWNTITSVFNSNALIMGLVISILSVGIIKLVLGR